MCVVKLSWIRQRLRGQFTATVRGKVSRFEALKVSRKDNGEIISDLKFHHKKGGKFFIFLSRHTEKKSIKFPCFYFRENGKSIMESSKVSPRFSERNFPQTHLKSEEFRQHLFWRILRRCQTTWKETFHRWKWWLIKYFHAINFKLWSQETHSELFRLSLALLLVYCVFVTELKNLRSNKSTLLWLTHLALDDINFTAALVWHYIFLIS